LLSPAGTRRCKIRDAKKHYGKTKSIAGNKNIAGKITDEKRIGEKKSGETIAGNLEKTITGKKKSGDSDHILILENDQQDCGRRATSMSVGKPANGIRWPQIVCGC
jgi:hypothetical protein